jgi:hypothetical protein
LGDGKHPPRTVSLIRSAVRMRIPLGWVGRHSRTCRHARHRTSASPSN